MRTQSVSSLLKGEGKYGMDIPDNDLLPYLLFAVRVSQENGHVHTKKMQKTSIFGHFEQKMQK